MGGAILPLLGWVVGVVMMWLSPIWRRPEKWIATLVPIVAVIQAILALVFSTTLLPPASLATWNAIVIVTLLNLVVGFWLLARGIRRS